MWILTCESHLLDGKSVWLRPASKLLLGRTHPGKNENGAQVRFIDHKTISRKHLQIEVNAVEAGDSFHILKRSKITLTDKSKAGTSINNTSISNAEKMLDKTENVVRLGSSEHVFHINWIPKVLTFTNIPKSLKARKDALATYREKLEQTDIKLVTEYINNQTTHVVASKRNTTACLQALAQAKWLVSYSFVDALTQVVRPGEPDEHGDATPSVLVDDFVIHWPSEKLHPVLASTEPIQRPNELLLPNPQRSEIFDGLSFVFMSASQFESLMAPITACGGKALVLEPEPGTTVAHEYMSKIIEMTKIKKVSSADDFKKIIMIRSADPTTDIEWWTQFNTEVQLISNRRSILQGELLDAIVMLDTATLQQPLPEELQIESTRRSRTATARPEEIINNSEPATEDQKVNSSTMVPTKAIKRSHRTPAKPTFKGLTEFDPSQITRVPEEEEPLQIPDSAEPNDNDVAPANNALKRTAAQRDNFTLAAEMETSLHGLAAVKKRKLNNPRPQETPVAQSQVSDDDDSVSAEALKQKKSDFKARMMANRDEAELDRIRDEQALQDQLGGMDIKDIKPQIEVFEVRLSDNAAPQQNTTAVRRAGWDPKWNGRANFKAFRPQGQRNANNPQKSIMISLVEVPKKKGLGLGEEYWLNSNHSTSQNHNSNRTSNGQSHVTTQPDRLAAHESNGTSIVEDSLNQIASARSQGRSGKRPALEEAAGTAKRPRQSRLVTDDDDDDGLQFRRKRI